jgi:hypothetical protein
VKIDLNAIDRDNFQVEENIIVSNGLSIYFVKPLPNPKNLIWTQANKIFRSSVWDCEGNLISASFPKFGNWGENSENFPTPTDLNGCDVCGKVDGSLLIVSTFCNHTIYRTRGTLDATTLKNGPEIEIFKRSIFPRMSRHCGDFTWPISWLFEWTSPLNKSVINYGNNPAWYLVGLINHDKYTLSYQHDLDDLAVSIRCGRPRIYDFTGSTPDKMIDVISKWKDREGAVVYSNDGQSMHKIKSSWYLAFKRMKDEISRENLIKAWFELNKPDYKYFTSTIENYFGIEIAAQIRGDMSIICDSWKEVLEIIAGFNSFIKTNITSVGNVENPNFRKEMKNIIVSSYGKTSRADYVLKIVDGKELNDNDLEHLLYQCIKNRK